jgi:hypothetical protein
VPADPTSPIPAALTQLAHTDPCQLQDAEAPRLLAHLAGVPDPRAARGRRHPLLAILGLAAAAVLAGARSIAAIAEWAADAPQPVRAALSARHHAPGHFTVPAEATIRRTLAHLDADALAAAVGAWLADREPRTRGPGPSPEGVHSAPSWRWCLPSLAPRRVRFEALRISREAHGVVLRAETVGPETGPTVSGHPPAIGEGTASWGGDRRGWRSAACRDTRSPHS